MILSMTGYGTSSAQRNGSAVSVEVRTLNHRFLDIHVRLGREFGYLESEIQQVVRNQIGRGRVEVSVTIRTGGVPELLIDSNLAKGYLDAADRLREQFGLEGALDLRTLLTLPGVLKDKDTEPEPAAAASCIKEAVLATLQAALQGVLRMRHQEGAALRTDMLRYLMGIGEKTGSIQALLPLTVEEYRTKLEERLNHLITQKPVDPQRLAQEVAILAERADVSEEIARLGSHLAQYSGLMTAGKEVGKKLDFLLQEMQREVNTMLSKTGNLEITRLGIAIKADIEKLREQVQNVE